MSAALPSSDMTRIIERLQDRLSTLTAASCSSIYDSLPSYATVDVADLHRSISGNMRIAVEVLATGRVPLPADVDQAAVVSMERFAVGVDVEDLILAFRISFRDIHEAFTELAATTLSVAELTLGTRNLWDASDAFVGRAVSEYSQLRLDKALAHAGRRTRSVSKLLSGEQVTPSELQDLGLTKDCPYAVLRTNQLDKCLQQQVLTTGSLPSGPALLIELDDSFVGILTASPVIPTTHLAAIGSFGPLSKLQDSDAQARRVLQVARLVGKSGLLSAETLGWRMALPGAEETTARFRDKFISPLLERGDYGADLLRTVASWIRHSRNYAQTAESERLHVNSVRHRIARFSAITGYTDDTDDFIGLVWALETSSPPV